MEEESFQERQSNELEALRAIFTDQCVNCNEKCEKWKPLNVILTVYPQREHSGPLKAHVQVDLHIIATEQYPEKVPQIMLEKPKGLSDKLLAQVLKELEKIAASKIGEVMIYELVQHVQSVLTECNKPGYESFYEEMLSRQKEEKQKEVERLQSEENIKRQLIELEVRGIKKERQRKNKVRNKLEEFVETEDFLSHLQHRKSNAEDNVKIRNADNGRIALFDQNCRIFSELNPNSRLCRDFDVLGLIGEGAYGKIFKARNKLDDCLYAIKRIKLNQKNVQLNKKIMREVKLLSSLNHENVVRYYNSWLEDVDVEQGKCSEEIKKTSNVPNDKLPTENLNLSFQFPSRIESFSDDDEDDDDDWIEFRNEDETATDAPDSVDSSCSNIREPLQNKYLEQHMYIQMEYCEKNTLRNAIDDNLYRDENRVWRLLREVVEGLAYIHQQGIIHRDLKPVNIFIDSNDHVKIGDFGLATPTKPCIAKVQQINVSSLISGNLNMNDAEADASYTGQVGTVLYVAPELNVTNSCGLSYNQKVDIYSLGIIFFEMCYRPFSTMMERYKALTSLRLDSRNFPDDFYDPKLTRQIKLIRELLNHNPSERPNAADILKKEYLPLAELENEKFHETIRHTLCNPQSKAYKHLVAECFSQKVSVAEDITFDERSFHNKTAWQHAFIEMLADTARKVFHLHGGTYFSTPFLSPNDGVGIVDSGAVSLMTRSGNLTNLPYDLRLSFARYLAQHPSVRHMKRYTVDRVFRERRMLGTHPKEIFECTFDVVSTSSSNFTMEAEVISIVCEILDGFSESLQKNCVIRLNHVSLVSAILFHHHVISKKHVAACNFLNKTKLQTGDSLTKITGSTDFTHFGLTEAAVATLINALNVEVAPSKMAFHFSNLMKKSSASASYCKQAIRQLETLVHHLLSLQIKCPIVIAPSVITNFPYYSGLMFQVVWERKNKNRQEKDIIAAGGRYDNLISQYRNALNVTKETEQSAVGLSLFLDKIICSLQTYGQIFSTVDVVVCSIGKSINEEEKLKIIKDLWSSEIRSTILDVEQSLEETQEYCADMNIPHILFIKESEPGVAKLRSWYKDRFHEKTLPLSEIVPYLKRTIKTGNHSHIESTNNNNQHQSRSESRSASVSNKENGNRFINITFLFDEKLNASSRRRYENQISNAITNSLYKISSKVKIEIVVLQAEYELIRALVSVIDVNVKDHSYVASLVKKFPKYKKCLHRIADLMDELQSRDPVPVIAFFNLPDNNFKILI